MKKITAIFIVIILLYATTGYYFTVYYLQQQQVQTLQHQLNQSQYDEASLIEISVPLSLPYYNNWADFERYDGQIETNGITYTYVKRKVQDGKLILKCLPNTNQQKIKATVTNWFAGINGFAHTDSSQKASSQALKFGIPEYENLFQCHLPQTFPRYIKIKHFINISIYQNAFATTLWQPPRAIC